MLNKLENIVTSTPALIAIALILVVVQVAQGIEIYNLAP